jgi:capsule synthesis protein PGA_cap
MTSMIDTTADGRLIVDGWQPLRPGRPTIGMLGDIVLGANAEASLASLPVRVAPALEAWAAGLDLLVVPFDGTFPGPDPKAWRPLVFAGPRTVDCVPRGKRTLFSLATNHTFDGGSPGFLALQRCLGERGIETVGAGMSKDEAERPWRGRVHGHDVIVCAAVHAGCHPRAPMPDGGQVASLDSETWWQRVAAEAGRGTLIVLLHGGIQGSHLPSPRAVEISARLTALGAAAVVWTHAHAIQGIASTPSGFVAYGLGNALHLPLDGDIAAAHPDPAYDVGLFLEFQPDTHPIRHAAALLVERHGLHLRPRAATARDIDWFRRISKRPGRLGYGLQWRWHRLREDVVVPALRVARSGAWKRVDVRSTARLFGRIANARADAEDV